MTDTSWTIEIGDVYCPFCGGSNVGLDFTHEDHFWFCDRCHQQWKWEHDGTDWVWPADRVRWPGCPYCGTRNIGANYDVSNWPGFGKWNCGRLRCGKSWVGRYEIGKPDPDGPWHVSRWTIRVPVRDVPFRRTLDHPTT